MITRENTARLLMTELGITDIDSHIERLIPIWDELDRVESEKADLEIEQLKVQNEAIEKRSDQPPSLNRLQRSTQNGQR